MKKIPPAIALALACPFSSGALAQSTDPSAADAGDAPSRRFGIVTITGARPTSLPTEIPTTTESATAADIARTVNATDSEDALKYFPSLLVRKRYIGDYNHAILSSRASGTGNSARSAVYADGILLSNFLGNGVGGLAFPPRWGLVTPEEIERVDVMYGPFSAAYPGNSAGAVVDYVTRMPTKFEAHARASYQSQPVDLYGTHHTYDAWETSASIGNRAGDLAWWIDASHTDSQGQPLTFATRLASTGTAGGTGTPVTGAIAGRNPNGQPWWIIGSGTQYHTQQDHLKFKLAYDLTPTLRASYVLGLWRNTSDGRSESYLRDASGNPVYGGAPIQIGGASYAAPTGSDFATTHETLLHDMHGLSLKSHTLGTWDWEVAASLYDYHRDDKRQSAANNLPPAALDGGPGTLADGSGTGWHTLALKGTWRPYGLGGRHVVDFGFQQEDYELSYLTSNIAGDYLSDGPGPLVSDVQGRTRLQSAYAQDVWQLAPDWRAVLGGRAEHWSATDGLTVIAGANAVSQRYEARHVDDFSPKAALSWQLEPATVLKASIGRAVRMPTVGELYGATSTTNSQYINDPGLAPERSWTGELSAEHDFDKASGRLTLFAEDTRDALYTQYVFDAVADRNVSRVQNVGRIATVGVEAVAEAENWLADGLDLSGSVTFADSTIRANAGFVSAPGDTIGKEQPNIPRWRATALASYRFTARWTGSVGARYSGPQYRTLNNADVNGATYQGVSRFMVVDVRTVWRFAPQWTAAFGIDNLNNDKYWNFHPYPQRTYSAELKFDL